MSFEPWLIEVEDERPNPCATASSYYLNIALSKLHSPVLVNTNIVSGNGFVDRSKWSQHVEVLPAVGWGPRVLVTSKSN